MESEYGKSRLQDNVWSKEPTDGGLRQHLRTNGPSLIPGLAILHGLLCGSIRKCNLVLWVPNWKQQKGKRSLSSEKSNDLQNINYTSRETNMCYDNEMKCCVYMQLAAARKHMYINSKQILFIGEII